MKSILKVLQYLLPVGIAVLLLYLAFKNINFAEFLENLNLVDYRWVIFSIALSIVGYLARAYRWNLLITPLGYHPTLYKTTLSVLVGYLANLALPRLGEVVRCGIVKRTSNIPINVSLGSVIAERVIDLFSLTVLILIALFLEFEVLYDFVVGSFSVNLYLVSVLAIIFLVSGALGIWIFSKFQKRGRFEALRNFLLGLREGLISLRKVRSPMGFVLSTIVLWSVYYFMSYTIIFSLSSTSHLSMTTGLLLLVVGGIAISLPVQAGFGTYHTMIASLLTIYSIEEVTGLFLATLLHTSQVVAVAIFGGLALILSLLVTPDNESDKTKNSYSEGSPDVGQ